MKKILYIFLIFILIFFCLKSCIKKDLGYDIENYSQEEKLEQVIPKNIAKYTKTIDGVDYLVTTSDVGKFGGRIITSTIGEGPKTFNTYVSNDATSSSMADIMYDGLLTTNPINGEIEVKLAKNIEILPDNKTYIVELRHGIKWSDGVEITADDVVYTFNTIVFGGFGNTSTRDSLYVNGKLPTVEKIGKYKIKFETPTPFAPFLRNLSIPIAPKHVFKKATDKGKNYFNSFYSTTTNPKDFVVSGAFKLKEYVPAQRVIFEKNPNYYLINKKDEKLPYLDYWVTLIVGDLNNEMIKFEAGEIDIVTLQSSMISKYKMQEKNSDYKLYNLGATTNTSFLAFNLNDRKNEKGKFYVDPIKQKWFQDKNFRSAIDYAIDRDNLVLNILYGVGQPLFSAESPKSLFLNEKIAKGHKQDIEYAKKLLKESGYILKDKNLYDKYGNKVEFELMTNAGNTQREATGVSIKDDLASIGIKVNFKPIEFNTLVNKLTNTMDFETVIISLTSNPFEPHSGYNVWHSMGVLHLFNQRKENETNTKKLAFEKELDEIYNKASIELEFEKRKALYDRYQEIIYEEKPMLYLYSPINIVAIRKKFGNINPTPLSGALYNLEEIYIK
ncbi:MAG: ABC transporter substrate-binding protein [Cyanobacteria bacterium SIG30]|nr:ABC transporter substrate-binding protein [Cyanobacteria bacterium SIG30]